ncbi:hypothetical protein AZL_c04810 (plasmid) [Azospirillum sp. B510]|uniref:autotransporter family protein n=1 Tax=Azospirillum sp. (strain B510) TaxID=137722 RepID=UPI0001C4CA5D|nr:autotransporter domain-containing protein [Azospirillum sp. B510]BAI75774.1 hypothetical protein AZL_c04810 [Azospirillum sp. B510]
MRHIQLGSVSLLAIAVAGLSMPAFGQTIANSNASALLSPFSSLSSATLQQNLSATVAVNNAATDAQRLQAYNDALNLGPSLSPSFVQYITGTQQLSDGLGPRAGKLLSSLTQSNTKVSPAITPADKTLFDTINQAWTLAQADSEYNKNYFGNQNILKNAYGYSRSVNGYPTSTSGDPRPYLVSPQIRLYTGSDFPNAPYGLPGSAYNGVNSGSFPSGHATGGYTFSLVNALMVPERFQESLTRGSEYGYSRIVMGVHYALDVIAGRILATYDLAQMLNNNPSYVGATVGGVVIPADYKAQFDQATANYRNSLQSACGAGSLAFGALSSCVNGEAGDRFSNKAQNKADWTYRLTYGLSPVGPTTLAPVVPQGAEVLLSTRFPYLTADQRREVLATTELPSGYPLDDGSGWARLDLYAAADGYAALNSDVTVTMDAAKGGFNAADSWNNDITGTGRLIKNGTGTLTLSGRNSFGGIQVSGGTLALTGTESFSGASRVEDAGTLAMAIDGTTPGAGAGHYAQITGTGSATFLAGGLLRPIMGTELANSSGYRNPAIGSSYVIVTTAAANGVSGRFAGLAPSAATTAMLLPNTSFGVAYYPNAIILYVAPTSYADAKATGTPLTANQQAAASALDRVRGATGNGVSADSATSILLAGFGTAGTGDALRTGLTTLSGAGTLGAASSSLTVARGMGQSLGARMTQLHDGRGGIAEAASRDLFSLNVGSDGGGIEVSKAAASGNGGARGISPWVRGLGVFSRNSGDGNAPGNRATIGGGVAGVDLAVSDEVVVGAGFGYARSRTRGSDGSGRTDGDNYQLAAYGTWTPGAFFVDGSLGYTLSRYDTRRDIAVGGLAATASGDTHGGTFGAAMRAGKRFTAGGLAVEPDVGLSYHHVRVDGFTERGAGAFNLTVGDTRVNSLRSSLGGRVVGQVRTENGLALEPEARVHWEHEFADRNAETTMAVVGQPFTIAGSHVGRDAAVLGVGLAGVLGDDLRLFTNYDATLRRHQTDHAVTVGLKASW